MWAIALFGIVMLGAVIHAALLPLGAPMAPWLWWLVPGVPLAAIAAVDLN